MQQRTAFTPAEAQSSTCPVSFSGQRALMPEGGAAIAMLRLLWRLGRAGLLASWHVAAHRASRGAFLARFVEELGPTFIKIGQILSCRPDLLPAWAIDSLRRLQDRMTPIERSLLPALLSDAMGRAPDEVFASFDFEAVSSASIASVYRATLRDGSVVAVKLRRPGLGALIETDLKALQTGARWLEKLPALTNVALSDSVEEFGQVIRQQLDFVAEAESSRRFRRNFARKSEIRFARTEDALCSESVLTMEFLEGLQSLNALEHSSAQAKRVATLTLRTLFSMIFEHGFIHADMHPGNVFCLPDGSLAFLDTGFVVELAPIDQKNFAGFFFGMVSNNGKECARILMDTATSRSERFDPAVFERKICELVAKYFARTAREFEVTKFSACLFDIMRSEGLRGSTKFMTTLLALVVFEGVAKQIDPALDFQAEARNFIPLVLRGLMIRRDSIGPARTPTAQLASVKQYGRRSGEQASA